MATLSKENIILASTYHDPSFRLRILASTCLDFIKKHFKKVVISYTPMTSPKAIAFLEEKGFITRQSPSTTQVDTYNAALELALNLDQDIHFTKIFYSDFDRLIHWIVNYPEELKKVLLESSKTDFLHLGRSPRAFDTHPKTQKMTEVIINELCSNVLELKEKLDLLSACFIITKSLAKGLLHVLNHTPSGIYYTWPLYLWKHGMHPKYLEVEGLEWETPDQYQPEISREGYENWVRGFQSFEQWNKRVQFISECVEEIKCITECKLRNNF